MPQPFPKRGLTFGFPNPFSERPEHAVALANVCANWALVEHELVHMYAILLGNSVSRRPKRRHKQAHPLAYQIFESLYALPPRLELLRKLVKQAAPEHAATFHALLPEISDRFKERSIVAHAVWSIEHHREDIVVRTGGYEPDRASYTVKDFENISRRISALYTKLYTLTEKFREPTRITKIT